MNANSNLIELNVDNYGEKIVFFYMYHIEEDIFSTSETKLNRKDVETYEPTEYHINLEKVFEKHHTSRKPLIEFERGIPAMNFTKEEDFQKITITSAIFLGILKENKNISQDPNIIKHYLQNFKIGQKKDFD